MNIIWYSAHQRGGHYRDILSTFISTKQTLAHIITTDGFERFAGGHVSAFVIIKTHHW